MTTYIHTITVWKHANVLHLRVITQVAARRHSLNYPGHDAATFCQLRWTPGCHRLQQRKHALHFKPFSFSTRSSTFQSYGKLATAVMTGATTYARNANEAVTVGNVDNTSHLPLIRETKIWPISTAISRLRYRNHEADLLSLLALFQNTRTCISISPSIFSRYPLYFTRRKSFANFFTLSPRHMNPCRQTIDVAKWTMKICLKILEMKLNTLNYFPIVTTRQSND